MDRRTFALTAAAAAAAASAAKAQQQPAAPAAAAPPARQPDPARITRQVRAADYQAPEGVDFRSVTIWSDGIRLHGEVFTPKGVPASQKLPAVVQAHGWGGVAAGLRNDAADIARAGYFVLVFDYRGWGESGSPVTLVQAEGPYTPGQAAPFTAQVQPLREYINPLEQAEDWFSALDWIMGEPQVDTKRVGIRGSSYSGGHVLHIAANDPRVKAVVSQVGGIGSRPRGANTAAEATATQLARGEIKYPAPRASAIMGLIGTPIGHKAARYATDEEGPLIKAATLMILVENEEYGGNPTAQRTFASIPATTPKRLHMIPGVTHYAVYSTERNTVVRMAIEWFNQYLKA